MRRVTYHGLWGCKPFASGLVVFKRGGERSKNEELKDGDRKSPKTFGGKPKHSLKGRKGAKSFGKGNTAC